MQKPLDWELTVIFAEPDQYNLFLIIALDADTREALSAAELPAIPRTLSSSPTSPLSSSNHARKQFALSLITNTFQTRNTL